MERSIDELKIYWQFPLLLYIKKKNRRQKSTQNLTNFVNYETCGYIPVVLLYKKKPVFGRNI